MIRSAIFAGAVCLFSLTFVLTGQNNPKPQQSPATSAQKGSDDTPFTLTQDVRRVLIPVSVTTKDGKTLDNLPQSAFQIFEDNVQQQINIFAHDDVPLSLGLVIDNSGSMRNKRQRVNS